MFPSQWNFQWLSLCCCSLEMLKSCMNALFGRVLVRLIGQLFTRTLVKSLRWRSGWQKGHSGWHAYITTQMDRKGVERWPAIAGCIPRDDLLSCWGLNMWPYKFTFWCYLIENLIGCRRFQTAKFGYIWSKFKIIKCLYIKAFRQFRPAWVPCSLDMRPSGSDPLG